MSSSPDVTFGPSTVRTVLDDPPARHVAAPDRRVTTARGWAAGGLAVSTLALLVLVGMGVTAIGGPAPGAAGALGPASVVLPVILVGWCTGFATVSVIVRHDAVAPPLAGLAGAALGTCLGGALLAVQAGL